MGSAAATQSGFVRDTKRFPMLGLAEERELARRWREDADGEACDRLVQSHLRLVVRIANQFRGYGRPIEDFISVGCVGLMQAVQRYDPDRGARLSTYAMWWIRAAMQAEIMRTWSLVKIGTTVGQKKLFFGLRRARNHIGAVGDGALDDAQCREIAEILGVTPGEVADMDRRLARTDQSLNVTLDAETGAEFQDTLVDSGGTPEALYAAGEESRLRHRLLMRSLGALDARERRIVEARRLHEEPMTLRMLGAELGISCERVRQIEARALAKLGDAMRSAMCDDTAACGEAVLRHAA